MFARKDTILVDVVLIKPASSANEEHLKMVRSSIPHIQGWWRTKGDLPLLLGDPLMPLCQYDYEWFAKYPGGQFYAAQQFAYERGYVKNGNKALIFLDGYIGDGEAGNSGNMAVVNFKYVYDLPNIDYAQILTPGNKAVGCVTHEVGHLAMLKHINIGKDIMSDTSWWTHWPQLSCINKPDPKDYINDLL